MSWEQFGDGYALKHQDQREAAAVVNKPIVDIYDAAIHEWFGSGKDILCGTPINHPNQSLNGKDMHSSAIVRVDGNTVETRNTIYNVLDWHVNGT